MYLVVNSGRMVQKIVTASGQTFTVAPSNDHTDGSWGIGSLYDGEFGINSATAELFLRISGTVYQIGVSGSAGVTLPVGTSAQTLRYDSGAVLVANDILKNDGSDVFIGTGGPNIGRLFSTINHLTDHNIILKNANAGGRTVIEFQDNAAAEQFDIGLDSGDLIFGNPSGLGLTLTTAAKAKLTQNSAAIHEILILQNLNSSAPVYLVFLNSAGAEKFYAGYRQAQTRFDIFSADNSVGLVVDNNGRTGVGIFNNAYFAPDQSSVLTVETRSDLTAYGMTMRHVANTGINAPIHWQYTNSGATLVYYASVMGDIIDNSTSAHYGNLTFQVAISGVMTTRLVLDENGIGVIYGGTGKNTVAVNKFLYTSATDVFSEAVSLDVAEQTVVTTIAFTAGTPPSGATTHTYRWSQNRTKVHVRVNLVFATAGATVTGCLIPFPADLPAPAVPTGFSGANAILTYGSGGASATVTNLISNIGKAYIRRNAADTGWEFGLDLTSSSSKVYYVNITYYT